MQDSQLRWMIGLSLLVLALVAALSMGDGDGDGADPADPDATIAVVDMPDMSQVVRLERLVAGETLTLVRDETGWTMKSPYAVDADGAVVDRLLDDIREMDRGVPLETEGVGPEEFGLGEPPTARVTLGFADGSSQTVVYGDAAPVGWRTYARGPDGEVVAVGGRSELLLEPSGAFRDHRVFRFDPAAVRQVRITHEGNVLDVSGQGTSWWVEGFTRADPDRVDDLVMALLDLRFDRVMALEEPANPRAMVEIGLDDGSVQVIRVGERTPMGDVVSGPVATGMVYPESLAVLGVGPTDVGDRRAIPLHLDKDERVELEIADGSWTASRTGTTWSSSDRGEAETTTRLQALGSASIAYRMEPVDQPQSVFATVRLVRGEHTKVIEIGPEEEGFHRARDLDGGEPYRIRTAELAPALQ